MRPLLWKVQSALIHFVPAALPDISISAFNSYRAGTSIAEARKPLALMAVVNRGVELFINIVDQELNGVIMSSE